MMYDTRGRRRRNAFRNRSCARRRHLVLLGLGLALAAAAAASASAQVITITSPQQDPFGGFGGVIAPIADLTADGMPDLLIRASHEAVPGQWYHGQVHHLALPGFAPVRVFSTPDPAPVTGYTTFGFALASVADLDGDGAADLLFGDYLEGDGETFRSGRVHVFSGAGGAHIRSLAAPEGELGGYGFGKALANLGDHDGDGLDEFAVGSDGELSRRVYIFSGNDELPTFILGQLSTERGFGEALARVPDLDGDGHADLIVAARRAVAPELPAPNNRLGKVFVYSGATGDELYWVRSPNPLARMDFGWSIAGIEDLDGDGRGDFLAASPVDNLDGGWIEWGQVHAFSGATGEAIYTINAPGVFWGGRFGHAIAVTPDLDGDGRQDFVVGAPLTGHPPADGLPSGCGAAYVYSGATGGLLRRLLAPEPAQNDGFGAVVSAIGQPPGHPARAVVLVNLTRRSTVHGFYVCRADANADGRINSNDISRFLSGWIQTVGLPPGALGPPGVHHGDFNGDGVVNSADISDFLGQWLQSVAAGGCL